MNKLKEFDVWEHFTSWEGWECGICGEMCSSDERELKKHMLNKHKMEFKK